MYAGMIDSVLSHTGQHLQTARVLCAKIADGEGEFEERIKTVEDLKTEILIMQSDLARTLLYFGVNVFEDARAAPSKNNTQKSGAKKV
jgi:hypothetical protein